MDAITEKQKSLIVNNIVKACDDIEKLNGTGYKYIYLACGFIAHYNINGFKGYYSNNDLARDILNNADSNRWNNFREGDQNYHYYKSKADIYKRIVDKLSNKALNLYNS
jgi:hypothetical protein